MFVVRKPLVRCVQVAPPGLVANLPVSPTATHCPLAYATPFMFVAPKPLVLDVQVTPSGLVASLPASPTVTHWPLPNATPLMFVAAGDPVTLSVVLEQ